MGLLAVGDQLPTVKEVVAQVAVNPNTVTACLYASSSTRVSWKAVKEWGRSWRDDQKARRPAHRHASPEAWRNGSRQRDTRGSTTSRSKQCSGPHCART